MINTTETAKNEILDEIKKTKNTEIIDVKMIKDNKIININNIDNNNDNNNNNNNNNNENNNSDIILSELNKLDDKKELIKLHEKYMKNITIEDNETKYYLWNPKSLEFMNLFSYGGNNINKIEFKTGVTSITGPNGNGKSSIPHTLYFILFETLLYNPGRSPNTDILNNKQDNGYIEAVIQHGLTEYTIRKEFKRGNNRDPLDDVSKTLTYIENGKKTVLKKSDVKNKIRELFGSIQDFYKLNVLDNRNQHYDFFRLKENDKIKYLKQIFRLEYFDKLVELNKNESSVIKSKIIALNIKINNNNNEMLENSEELIKKTNEELDKLKQDKIKLEEENNKLQIQYEELYKNKVLQENNLVNMKSITLDKLSKLLENIKKKYNDFTISYDLNELKNKIKQNNFETNKTIKGSELEITNQLVQKEKELELLLKTKETKWTKEELYGLISKYKTEKVQLEKEIKTITINIQKLENNNNNNKNCNKTKKELENEIKDLQKQFKEKTNFSETELLKNNKFLETQIKKNNNKKEMSNEENIKQKTILKKDLSELEKRIMEKYNKINNFDKNLIKEYDCEIDLISEKIIELQKKIKNKYDINTKTKINMIQYNKTEKNYQIINKEIEKLLLSTLTDDKIDEYVNNIEELNTKDKLLKQEFINMKTNVLIPLKLLLINLKNDNLDNNRKNLKNLLMNKDKLKTELDNYISIIENNNKIDELIQLNKKNDTDNNLINLQILNYEYHKLCKELEQYEQNKQELTNNLKELEFVEIYNNLINKLDDNKNLLEKISHNNNLEKEINENRQCINIIEYNELKELLQIKEKELEIINNNSKESECQYQKKLLENEIEIIKYNINILNKNKELDSENKELQKQLEYELIRVEYNDTINKINIINNNIKIEKRIKRSNA